MTDPEQMVFTLLPLLFSFPPPPPAEIALCPESREAVDVYYAWVKNPQGLQVAFHDGSGAIEACLSDINALSASQSVSGYVIELICNVYPLNDPNYTSIEVVGDGQENWPILLPPGITLKGGFHPSLPTPAGFGATGAYPAATPFIRFVDAPNANYSGAAKVKDLYFIGGEGALDFAAGNGSTPLEVLIQGCTFVRNRIGLDAAAVTGSGSGQDYSIRVEDCVIQPAHYAVHGTIQYSPCSVGFRFRADAGSNSVAPQIHAEVVDLTVSSPFASSLLGPLPPFAAAVGCDLAGYTPPGGSQGHFTRLIEVQTQGNENRLEFDSGFAQQPIAAVDLTVSGGSLDGGIDPSAGNDTGWDVGIYAMTGNHSGAGDLGNYTSRYSITATGAILQNLRAAGVYVQVGRDARGELILNGSTEIQNVGAQSSVQNDDILSTGVHAVASRGYLAVVTNRADIRDNRGNGVLCFSPSTGIGLLPFGLFLRLKNTAVQNNGRSGVILDAGYDHANFSQLGGGVAGGTRDLTLGGGMSLVRHSSKPFYGALPLHGQGTIQNCAISTSQGGRYGILCRVRGSSLRPESNDTLENFSAASCRIVNTYVWGFAMGGYFADLDKGAGAANEGGPTLLTPVLHSTLVDNPAFSVDIIERTSAQCRYYRDDPVGGEYLNTMIAHSILDTRTSGNDFGPNLDPFGSGNANWRVDTGTGGTYSTDLDKPHVASIRGLLEADGWSMPSWTDKVPVYQGQPSGLHPDQWFLAIAGQPSELLETATFLNAGGDLESEADTDIEGTPRPVVSSGFRDKGGEED